MVMKLTQKIFLFLLACSSTLGRIVNNETIKDIVTNVITKNEDIPLPVSIDNVTVSTTENTSPCLSVDVSENEVESDENTPCAPKHKIDNGTGLLLTPLIEARRFRDARNASKVNPDLFLGYNSYSGFLTVDKRYNSNIFFWYFPQEKRPKDAPWILWLQGGPGGSSLIGLFDEIGPFKVDSRDVLRKNPFTWLQNHSLLFFDSPVGTGYSFTEHEDGFSTDLPTYTSHLYFALKQFLLLFPELKGAPLFLAGESYAGKYIPALAMEIHKFKDSPGGDINLKGLIMGNAFMGPEMLSHMELPYYYFGLLDKQQIEQIQPMLDSLAENVAAGNSVSAKKQWLELISVILTLTEQYHLYNFLRDDLSVGLYTSLLERSEVKRAIHVGDIQYDYFNTTVNEKLEQEFLTSTKNMMEQILDHYKVLSYCGQLDQMVPCVAATENYQRWRWNGSEEFIKSTRSPYMFQNKLAGYCKSGGNLTEVVIRGAGHMVALDKPEPLMTLVSQWTYGRPLALKSVDSNITDVFVASSIANDSVIYYL